jgi:hypothetical protein
MVAAVTVAVEVVSTVVGAVAASTAAAWAVVAGTSVAVGHRVAEASAVGTIIPARRTIFHLLRTVRFPEILIPGAP